MSERPVFHNNRFYGILKCPHRVRKAVSHRVISDVKINVVDPVDNSVYYEVGDQLRGYLGADDG